MKKQLLTLSLSTALSTALLTTFLPTTSLHASAHTSSSSCVLDVEESAEAATSFAVHSHTGIAIDETTLPSSDQYDIHRNILTRLQKHFTQGQVQFQHGRMLFTYHPSQGDQEGKLTYKSVNGVSAHLTNVVSALPQSLKQWLVTRNDFVENYFADRQRARDLTILRAVNERYGNKAISINRAEPLDTALDGTAVRTISRIIQQTKKDASRLTPPLTENFKTRRDTLWIALAATTLQEEQRGDETKTEVRGNILKQAAFQATHQGLVFSNKELSQLIANLRSNNHHLPRSPNQTYQDLLGAEAVLTMVMFQRYLVDPKAIKDLFEANKQALKVEQEKFAESEIRKERAHRLLATDLIPVDMLRKQDRELAGVNLTDDEADAYGNAGNDHAKKASIVREAKARIAQEELNAARTDSGVPGLTDEEAYNWHYYNVRDNQAKKDQILETAKARLAKIEEEKEAALALERTQALEAAGIALTEDELTNFMKANEDIEARAAIVEAAKTRISALRTAVRGKLGIAGLTDQDIDLHMSAEGEDAQAAVLKVAIERIVAESQVAAASASNDSKA